MENLGNDDTDTLERASSLEQDLDDDIAIPVRMQAVSVQTSEYFPSASINISVRREKSIQTLKDDQEKSVQTAVESQSILKSGCVDVAVQTVGEEVNWQDPELEDIATQIQVRRYRYVDMCRYRH